MIAAIRHGKLDGKLAALSASSKTGQMPVMSQTPPTGLQPVVSRPVPAPIPVPPIPVSPIPVPAAPGRDTAETLARAAAALTGGETVARPAAAAATATPETPLEPIAARPNRPATSERTLDQVILEYLTSEADQEQLVLLLEEERDLVLGARATLVLRASSSKSGQPVAGTQVSVRMISTVVEPRVLAAGRTDDRGVLALGFDIPQVGRGTSALIINAVSSIGRAELKHLL
jgi:hypothetical protein